MAYRASGACSPGLKPEFGGCKAELLESKPGFRESWLEIAGRQLEFPAAKPEFLDPKVDFANLKLWFPKLKLESPRL
jgi:hypothetical protein